MRRTFLLAPFRANAESVGTNASYIRKILSLLKKADIVDGRRGIIGYSLAASPYNLTLLQIYRAVTDGEKIHLLDIHQNANDKCIVGRYIKPVLTEMFADLEDSFAFSLKSKTLADCMPTFVINDNKRSKHI